MSKAKPSHTNSERFGSKGYSIEFLEHRDSFIYKTPNLSVWGAISFDRDNKICQITKRSLNAHSDPKIPVQVTDQDEIIQKVAAEVRLTYPGFKVLIE